ncbi:Nse1 non-SMC component of SMC5-6 complex-domain-containing protein [Aspergillus crustosus]
MPPNRRPRQYGDSNRAFLQAFMARSTLTVEEGQEILAEILSVKEDKVIFPEDLAPEDLPNYIDIANSAISPFDLEIRSALPQVTDDNPPQNLEETRVYALVNTTSDNLTQLATTFSADEISFIRRVLDKMFDTNNTRLAELMAVSSMEAIQLAKVNKDENRRESGTQPGRTAGAAVSLTMTQAETVLRRLVDDGWFEKSLRSYYTLSPRALMELKGWLVSTYNDDGERGRNGKIKFCAACRDILTVGQRCENRDCAGRLHDHCTRRSFRVQKAEQCPICKAPWPGNKFVGERATTTGGNRRGSNSNARRSGVAPATQAMEVDSD